MIIRKPGVLSVVQMTNDSFSMSSLQEQQWCTVNRIKTFYSNSWRQTFFCLDLGHEFDELFLTRFTIFFQWDFLTRFFKFIFLQKLFWRDCFSEIILTRVLFPQSLFDKIFLTNFFDKVLSTPFVWHNSFDEILGQDSIAEILSPRFFSRDFSPRTLRFLHQNSFKIISVRSFLIRLFQTRYSLWDFLK